MIILLAIQYFLQYMFEKKIMHNKQRTETSWLKKIIVSLHDIIVSQKDQEAPMSIQCDYINVNNLLPFYRQAVQFINKLKKKQSDIIYLIGQTKDKSGWEKHINDLVAQTGITNKQKIIAILKRIRQTQNLENQCHQFQKQSGKQLIQSLKKYYAKSNHFDKIIDVLSQERQYLQKSTRKITQKDPSNKKLNVIVDIIQSLTITYEKCQQISYKIQKQHSINNLKQTLLTPINILLQLLLMIPQKIFDPQQLKNMALFNDIKQSKEQILKRIAQIVYKSQHQTAVKLDIPFQQMVSSTYEHHQQNNQENKLIQQKHQLEKKISQMQKDYDSLHKKFYQMKTDYNNSEKCRIQFEDLLLSSHKLNQEIKVRIRNLLQLNQVQLIQPLKEDRALDYLLQSIQELLKNLRQTNQRLKAQDQQHKKKLVELQSKCRMVTSTDTIDQEYKKMQFKHNQLLVQNSRLQNELKNKQIEANQKDLAQTKLVQEYIQKIRLLQDINQNTNRKLEQDINLIQSLRQQNQRIRQNSINKIQQNEQSADLQSKLQQNNLQISKLLLENQAKNEQIIAIKKNQNHLKFQNNRLHDEINNFKVQIDQLSIKSNQTVNQTNKQKQKWLLEVKDLHQKLEKAEQKYKNQYKIVQRKLKNALNDLQLIQQESKSKDFQIQSLKLKVEMNPDTLKSPQKSIKDQNIEINLRQKIRENDELNNQLQKIMLHSKDMAMQLNRKNEQISKIQEKIKEQSVSLSNNSKNTASLNQKALEMSVTIQKEITMKVQGQLKQFKKKFCKQSKKRYQKLLTDDKDLASSNYMCMLYIDRFFQSELLQQIIDLKLRILTHLYRLTRQVVVNTRLIYKMDFKNKTNFHEYIDNTSNIICIVKTTNGAYLAGYYSGQYGNQVMTQPGLLISLTNNESYILSVPESGSKSSNRAMVYDPYFLIFGNAELRIKTGEKTVFCNFGIMNSYFNHRGKKVHDFLCAENKRETGIESYEVYQIIYDSQDPYEQQVYN